MAQSPSSAAPPTLALPLDRVGGAGIGAPGVADTIAVIGPRAIAAGLGVVIGLAPQMAAQLLRRSSEVRLRPVPVRAPGVDGPLDVGITGRRPRIPHRLRLARVMRPVIASVAKAVFVFNFPRPTAGREKDREPGGTIAPAVDLDPTKAFSIAGECRFLPGTRMRCNCGAPKPTASVGRVFQHAMQFLRGDATLFQTPSAFPVLSLSCNNKTASVPFIAIILNACSNFSLATSLLTGFRGRIHDANTRFTIATVRRSAAALRAWRLRKVDGFIAPPSRLRPLLNDCLCRCRR